MDEYCKKCDYILNITRTINEDDTPHVLTSTTPDDISTDSSDQKNTIDVDSDENSDDDDDDKNSDDDDDDKNSDDDGDGNCDSNAVDYGSILKKVENGEELENHEIASINIKDMVKCDDYRKMQKKGAIKKKIIDMQEDLGNSDVNTQAFLMCNNCHYRRKLDSGFRVLSKNKEGTRLRYNYINESSYRNKIHSRTIPRTLNFSCSNKSCPAVKEKRPQEAAFFRKEGGYETVFVCIECLTIKIN
jgi:hypothetical protein